MSIDYDVLECLRQEVMEMESAITDMQVRWVWLDFYPSTPASSVTAKTLSAVSEMFAKFRLELDERLEIAAAKERAEAESEDFGVLPEILVSAVQVRFLASLNLSVLT